ncbi:MAG TPA: Ig-like domain-containing protein, partial [Candidatus Saccharimonadales bacterium]|nr:Ig-like domain-containing protein [Candidatus Saccharimonadales bacterium]
MFGRNFRLLKPLRQRLPALLAVIALAVGWSLSILPPAEAAISGLKPPDTGLEVTSTGQAGGVIDTVALPVNWSDLEPTRGSFSGAGWGAIDSAIKNSNINQLKLRIEAGKFAPSWLNSVSGSCVTVTLGHNNESGCVPRYWTSAYLNEYKGLMQEIARRYDNEPKVRVVINAACMTINAEPFIKGGTSAGAALAKAGDSDAGEHTCMNTSMADMMAAFQHTRISVAGHVAWQIPVSGGLNNSWPEEHDILQQWRSQYGEKFIFQDNGLSTSKATCSQSSPTPANASGMWCYMKAISAPKGAQQGCGTGTGCDQINEVLAPALKYNLCFVEHSNWNLSASQAASYDKQLADNCANVGSGGGGTPPPTDARPTITLTKPTDGSSVAAGTAVTIAGTARDDHTLTKVDVK